jgi:hypothetical protein
VVHARDLEAADGEELNDGIQRQCFVLEGECRRVRSGDDDVQAENIPASEKSENWTAESRDSTTPRADNRLSRDIYHTERSGITQV